MFSFWIFVCNYEIVPARSYYIFNAAFQLKFQLSFHYHYAMHFPHFQYYLVSYLDPPIGTWGAPSTLITHLSHHSYHSYFDKYSEFCMK